MPFHCCQPCRPDRRDRYIQFLRDPVVSIIDLNLHAFIISHSILRPSVAVRPSEEEEGSSTTTSDLLDKSPRRGIHSVRSRLLHGWDLTLFLQNYICPPLGI